MPSDSYFLVIYDDGDLITNVMGLDQATGGLDVDEPPVLFKTRAEARQAIRISTAREKLAQARGLPVNEDFLACKQFLKITPASVFGGNHAL